MAGYVTPKGIVGCFLPVLLFAGVGGCGDEAEREPTAAEVRRFTDQIDRAEAEAKAKAVRTSRAKEDQREKEHQARVPAQN